MREKDYSKYLQYYPKKVESIREYRLDTGASLREAKDVMDIVYARYESTGKMVQIPPEFPEKVNCKKQKADSRTGSNLGCGLLLLVYLLFGPIIVLTKKYMGKR